MSKNPIGVFDSGIGGLTVARSIAKLLPNESIVYFGDTKHLPYGDKSSASIRHYAAKITSFLLSQKCKSVVIACNTASAHANALVKDICGSSVPVVNVIDPVSEYVANHFEKGRIGVIATKGTVNTRIYPKKIKKLNDQLQVVSQATPLLAPMIEEGFFNNTISKTVIHSYLDKKFFGNLKGIVLGCTHYPLIKEEVASFYNGKTEVIDSAEIVAQQLKTVLSENKLLAPKKDPSRHFYISDYTQSFVKSTKTFFGEEIKLERSKLWD